MGTGTTRSVPGSPDDPVTRGSPGSTSSDMNHAVSSGLTASVGASVVGRSTPGSETSAPTRELTSVDLPAPVDPPTTASSGASSVSNRGSR